MCSSAMVGTGLENSDHSSKYETSCLRANSLDATARASEYGRGVGEGGKMMIVVFGFGAAVAALGLGFLLYAVPRTGNEAAQIVLLACVLIGLGAAIMRGSCL